VTQVPQDASPPPGPVAGGPARDSAAAPALYALWMSARVDLYCASSWACSVLRAASRAATAASRAAAKASMTGKSV
jgi:hypothetical protein